MRPVRANDAEKNVALSNVGGEGNKEGD